MRGRIALQKHFVQNYTEYDRSVLRKLWECPRVLASLWNSALFLHTDRAQITLGRSHDCCFCICEHVGFPPTAVDLLE
jgi:hypothetical protein